MHHHRSTPLPSRLLVIALAAPFLLGLSACTEVNRFLARAESKPAKGGEPSPQVAEEAPEPIPAPQEKAQPGKLYEWNGDGRRVSRIVVNTDEQKARFYDGNEQIGWTTVASGVSKFPTPTGHFEVVEKVANKRSNLYGKIYGAGGKVVRSDAKVGRDPIPAGARFEGAKMPYFLRLTNDGIGLHAGPIPRPGRPASHGCIRMPQKLAPVLFEHVDLGVKVSIVGSGPDYGNYVQKQRAIAAREKERREAAARQPAIAAEATGAATQVGPAATPVAGAAGDSTTAQSANLTETASEVRGSSPVDETPGAQPALAGPSTAEETGATPRAEETSLARQPVTLTAPQSGGESAGPSPAPESAAQVAQTVPPQPSSPGAPAVGAPPDVPPMPASLSPVAPTPYNAPPLQPAAAMVPAPVAPPAPSVSTSPPATPVATPAPPAAPAAAPPAISSEQPTAPAESNDG